MSSMVIFVGRLILGAALVALVLTLTKELHL